MKSSDLLSIVRKNLLRRPTRSLLSIFGVTLSVLLFAGIEAFSTGMEQALASGDKARTLIVYRENRFCPQTSFLPERYAAEISEIDGVVSVLPVKVFLNNCRTNLDMITFQGAPVETLLSARDLQLLDGDLGQFRREQDAALVGRQFAERRGLRVGDKFRFGDVTVKVSGIFTSPDTVQEGLILTHLEFLQRSAAINQLGTVTQFEVRVRDAADCERVAAAIDERFATAEEPTHTRPYTSFLAGATTELREILSFGRIFGAACVLVIVILISSTIYLSVHERRRELGILRAIGFRGGHLATLVLGEALVLALAGAAIGLGSIYALLAITGIAIGVEGVQVGFTLGLDLVFLCLALITASAIVAGIVPALQAARIDVIDALRS
ncbi:MAG: ABC transporter substrate-binding protein [Planctomycetota bacterium]|nr:MAG: ABC transporter substrate-binding protein [Planctomycetota bacterium]